MSDLPWPIIKTEWTEWTPELDRLADRGSEIPASIRAAFDKACKSPGWNPPVVQLGGKLCAINYCADHSTGRLHSYEVAVVDDHPFLRVLNSMRNAPRAVRHIYRRDVRLKYLRAHEMWDFKEDMDRAEAAWFNYRAA